MPPAIPDFTLSRMISRSNSAIAGCEASGIPGSGRRPAGQVENPRPLTEYDPEHPYIVAMYDLEEAG